MKTVSLDVHADASQLCTVTETGEVILEMKVPTDVDVLRGIIGGIPGRKRVVFEEGPLSKAMRSMLLRVRKTATQAKADDVVFTTPDGRAMYEWSDFPLRRFQDAIR